MDRYPDIGEHGLIGDLQTAALLPRHRYLDHTFLDPRRVGEVLDYMPVVEGRATDRHRLVRLVRGTMRFRAEIQPRFDYGRKPHELHLSEEGALFVCDDLTLTLHRADLAGRSLHEEGTSLERVGDGLRLTKTLRECEIAGW
jgi:hypothetical protein